MTTVVEHMYNAFVIADKLRVVDAWVGHPKGILDNQTIVRKFEDALDFADQLRSRSDWFDDIFKNDLN